MSTKTASAPKAPRYPSAPGKAQLCELVDQLGEERDSAAKLADKLREKKKALESEIRALVERQEEILAYVKKHVERLGLGEARGERYRAWTQDNTRPSFTLSCKAAELPEDLRKITYGLDDAAALVAYNRGQLPDLITATVGSHARLEPV